MELKSCRGVRCKPIDQYCDIALNRCLNCRTLCHTPTTDCENNCPEYLAMTTKPATTTTQLQTTINMDTSFDSPLVLSTIPLLIIFCIFLIVLVLVILVLLFFIPRLKRQTRYTKRDVINRDNEALNYNYEKKSMGPSILTTKAKPNPYMSSSQISEITRGSAIIHNDHLPVVDEVNNTEVDLKKYKQTYQNTTHSSGASNPEMYSSPSDSLVKEVTSAIEFRPKDPNKDSAFESTETSLKKTDVGQEKPELVLEETPLLRLELEGNNNACNKEVIIESPQNVKDFSITMPNFNSPERLYANSAIVPDTSDYTGRKKNKHIYDHLRKTPWVEGYYSEGQSIEVYVDLHTIHEDWAIKQLCEETGQLPLKFHIKHSTELNH